MESESRIVYTGQENLLAMQHAQNYNKFLRQLVRRFGNGAHTVLDFGAGLGAFAEDVQQWAGRLICIEADLEQIQILKDAGYETATNLASLQPETVDYVYSINVLEHIQNDREILERIFTVLKPGGRLFLYVPALQWLYSRMDSAVGHIRRYHKQDLAEIASGTGFIVNKIEYVDSLGVLATLLYKAFGNSKGRINTKALASYDLIAFPISRVLDKLFNQVGGKNLLVVCEKK
jgi:SAM-dependent methyltransferase